MEVTVNYYTRAVLLRYGFGARDLGWRDFPCNKTGVVYNWPSTAEPLFYDLSRLVNSEVCLFNESQIVAKIYNKGERSLKVSTTAGTWKFDFVENSGSNAYTANNVVFTKL